MLDCWILRCCVCTMINNAICVFMRSIEDMPPPLDPQIGIYLISPGQQLILAGQLGEGEVVVF